MKTPRFLAPLAAAAAIALSPTAEAQQPTTAVKDPTASTRAGVMDVCGTDQNARIERAKEVAETIRKAWDDFEPTQYKSANEAMLAFCGKFQFHFPLTKMVDSSNIGSFQDFDYVVGGAAPVKIKLSFRVVPNVNNGQYVLWPSVSVFPCTGDNLMSYLPRIPLDADAEAVKFSQSAQMHTFNVMQRGQSGPIPGAELLAPKDVKPLDTKE